MAQCPSLTALGRRPWICKSCQALKSTRQRPFSSGSRRFEELEIKAAPEINFRASLPARIIPASPSYFTGSPRFNDDLLLLQNLVNRHKSIPTLVPDQAPRVAWRRLLEYRSSIDEKIGAAKFAQLILLLNRLNKIHPKLRPLEVRNTIKRFQRPGAEVIPQAKPGVIDAHGRSHAVGRRKSSSAKVYLVEGTGEVLVNGKSLVQVFPRIHDRESALWALKTSDRLDKYNVFALVRGGGVTGQAEAITLGLAKALLVHEPALKPALRRAGCITRDPRSVERKKPGRLKARKRPTWVKR